MQDSMNSLGAIFDWDGVLIDSSAHHEESWNRLAAENHFQLPLGHFKQGFGMKNEAIIPTILNWSQAPAEIQRLSLRKEEFYREIIREWGISPLPGAEAFLIYLQSLQIPCVVGSSTHRKNIVLSLQVLGWNKFFKSLVTAEDVKAGKPDPEVFLKAAAKISVDPKQCVVFEDAHAGIAAALAGGMKVVAVTTTHAASELQTAHRVVERLDELQLADLKNLWC